MKVQTRGLLADLSTMKPPGPFSPLQRERCPWGDPGAGLAPSPPGPPWTQVEGEKGAAGLATAPLP